MKCFSCDKPKNKKVCGSCREILKIDLVNLILESDPIYLTEGNRYKYGRKPIFTPNEIYNIKDEYNTRNTTMDKLAYKYNVSKGTIYNIIHK